MEIINIMVVRLTSIQLKNRNNNITTQLSCIIKAFSDLRLVAQIGEEIEKVYYLTNATF